MKKITFLALACAMFMGSTAVAQEVTYVEDPGGRRDHHRFNKFSDNWFIQAEGGAGILISAGDGWKDDTSRDYTDFGFKDALGWKADLAVGKWFSPIIGMRIGAEWAQHRGITTPYQGYGIHVGMRLDEPVGKAGRNDYWFKQNFNNVGAFADVMINLTNWWCGYRPGRVYNAVLYLGGSYNWTFYRGLKNERTLEYGKYTYAGGDENSESAGKTRIPAFRFGLLNKLALSSKVDFLIDLRLDAMFKYVDGYGKRSDIYSPSLLLGFGYNFGKSTWSAPIVPVCPTWKYTDAEGDALVARLAAADAKIASLEKQLYDCLHREIPKPGPQPVVTADAPLATIYYPIGKSTITPAQKKVVEAVANVINNNDKNYVLTGWADNYTGTDKINAKLRKDRVNGVKSALTKLGVAEGRLDAQINDGNLTNFGAKSAALDRAVTVNEAK